MKKSTTKNSIWKIILIISSLFILIIFITRFTTINLNFWNKALKQIPNLSKPLQNKTYTIKKVTNTCWNEIRYDPINDFYIVAENDKITKLNNKGDATFTLNMNEKDIDNLPDFMNYNSPSYFVISWYGIYDLSKEKPFLEKFEIKWNEDGKMEWEEWTNLFHKLYENSDTVLWGFKKSVGRGRMNYPLYFRQNGKWEVLYTLTNVSQINTNNTFIKFRLNYENDYIPDKYDRLYLLKDIQNAGAYSNYNNTGNDYDNTDYPENLMTYGKEVTIETLSFEKEVYKEASYSFIPSDFGGTVVNKLTKGNSHFIFKTKAIKGAGFNNSPLETYFYQFTIPEKFKTENSLNFLYYKYPTNWNSDENQGVYVIKKETE